MATIHSTIISGAGASTALLPLLSGKTRILLVTDQNVGALEATQAIHRLLAAEGRKVEVIDTVPAAFILKMMKFFNFASNGVLVRK